jgi:hypothetical protein
MFDPPMVKGGDDVPFLCAKDLDLAKFIEIIRETQWPEDGLLLAFSPAQCCFDIFKFDEELLLKTEQGRIFSSAGEFRWRRIDGRIRAVYLGEQPPQGLDDFSGELLKLHTHCEDLILWGERTELNDEWLEQQIPKRIRYPLHSKEYDRGRIVLTVEHWVDDFDIPRFSRYRGIKEIENPSCQ